GCYVRDRRHDRMLWFPGSESFEFFAFSPDATKLLTTGKSGSPRIWKTDDLSLIGQLGGGQPAAYAATISPDGRLLFTAGPCYSLLWQLYTDKPPLRLPNDANIESTRIVRGVAGAAFTSSGQRLLTVNKLT